MLKYDALWPIFIFPNEILTFCVTIEANFAFWQHYLMKLKSFHTVLLTTTVLFTLLLPLSVVAQEDKGMFDPEIPAKESIKQDQESPSGTENPETRANKNPAPAGTQESAAVRDSELKAAKPTAVRPVEKSQKEEEKIQKEEEDPLSFNFLYYIIEKFKASDIVE
jgi:hypothetical protein